MSKFKRIFLIVMDSAGIGNGRDAEKFDDLGTNTFGHISEKMPNGLNIPTLNMLGIGDLDEIKGCSQVEHKKSYSLKLNEASNGKDTMTGHWEMMGIKTTKPFQTFTDTGFPKDLIDELERETGHKIIGNYASSGTEILKVLGEEQMRENSLIVYTSSDSVLQIAAHEEVTGLDELYRCCEIARKLCMKPEWFVGRIIARPYIGTNKDNFKRTSNRHDYTISPSGITTMDILKDHGYTVSCVGKINDIFNGVGVTETVHTVSNQDGMDKTIDLINKESFKEGFCFVNLVEFDSEFGHRRNPLGYGNAIQEFDVRLKEALSKLRDDDLLMVTADHGNDPTYKGTDHTREKVPLLIYSPSFKNGRYIGERDSFADIGETILRNFNLKKDESMIGVPINEVLND
jgi:phosphopentomutase